VYYTLTSILVCLQGYTSDDMFIASQGKVNSVNITVHHFSTQHAHEFTSITPNLLVLCYTPTSMLLVYSHNFLLKQNAFLIFKNLKYIFFLFMYSN